MPATRHVRREGRGTSYNPLALPALPAFPSFFSSSTRSATRSSTSDSTLTDATLTDATTADPTNEKLSSADLKAELLAAGLLEEPAPGATPGYSTDSTPFFLRRSPKSRRVDDVVQRADEQRSAGNT